MRYLPSLLGMLLDVDALVYRTIYMTLRPHAGNRDGIK